MLVRSTAGDVRLVAAAQMPERPAAPLSPPSPPGSTASDDARLDVLRALERGDIDIDAARRQLEELDHA
jgi:hypothetical protein